MNPISELVSMQLSVQEANISMKRLSEILDYEREQEVSLVGDESANGIPYIFDADSKRITRQLYQQVDAIDGDIELDHVTFRYGNRKPALNDISFVIHKGEKVALVGASGSGKSTVAKLLLKYYEPESGEIRMNGQDIVGVENASLRRAISYMPQTIELFSKSIYDNIRITRPNATLEEVKEAAKKADAHDFIRKLPMQYYTYLEEAGNGLSGGEKQRIALARAFLKENQFYILDESTSNLDFVTENLVFDMIYNKLKSKTMLIIAHRLATVKSCDRIIVMENGQIIEQGSHDELLGLQGKYYQLWEMQQGNFVLSQNEISENILLGLESDDDVETMTYDGNLG